MRGKEVYEDMRVVPYGITPAYAGKSYFHENSQRKSQDHPRLCGEKDQNVIITILHKGSPPPMRGKVDTLYLEFAELGITPAYAGKSPLMTKIFLAGEDHPRLCGEKKFFGKFHIVTAGSPPPMRGKVFDQINQK